MAQKRIALFGGTFDPVHLGHTAVADAAAQHIGAQKVIFIPAKRSPLKQFSPVASDKHRLEMITLAIAGNEKFQLSDCELKEPRPSYTLDTIGYFRERFGRDTSLYWLIGADSIEELAGWYKIAELIDGCSLSVMYRAGFGHPDFSRFEALWGRRRVEKLQSNVIATPLVEISSTEIRERLAAGGDVSEMLHGPVAEYISRNGLYRSKADL